MNLNYKNVIQTRRKIHSNLENPKFHREIAKKLCQFSEEVERDNYTQAIAEKYHMSINGAKYRIHKFFELCHTDSKSDFLELVKKYIG